jgi:hypothetical protein
MHALTCHALAHARRKPASHKEILMTFVTTQPDLLAAAAGQLAGVGSDLTAQNAAVLPPTTAVVPAAADEVSALTAAQFASHAVMYQAVSAHAAAVHDLFVTALGAAAGSYAATEAANASSAI